MDTETHAQREGHVMMETEIGGLPRIARNHQKLEEARKDPALEPSEGAWPYQHLDFGLPAFRTVKG